MIYEVNNNNNKSQKKSLCEFSYLISEIDVKKKKKKKKIVVSCALKNFFIWKAQTKEIYRYIWKTTITTKKKN
jgi:hypothetical protein